MAARNKAVSGILSKALKYKYVLAVLLIGLVLILLPIGRDNAAPEAESYESAPLLASEPSLETQEKRLAAILSEIDGVGEVRVLLSLKSSSRLMLAENGDEPLVINKGGGSQSAVETSIAYPEYLGAAVVCQGADSAAVRLTVVNAVRVFTGLPTDKISVTKMR